MQDCIVSPWICGWVGGDRLKDIIQWGLTEGQKFGPELGYVPLPPEIIQKASAAVNQIAP
ncbi:MAG: hypothetical protein HC866_21685 [Leptolyngbyaceae cyanobacterium RU_5_1]|nr:hypothetical protein [Leptolyngbyaceae cyanobacterium RU_5_1]